jgi:hypothetical protein
MFLIDLSSDAVMSVLPPLDTHGNQLHISCLTLVMALSSNYLVTTFIVTFLTNLVALSLSVHNTPPLDLVFMLLCESVCTQYPSPGFVVHVAL